jgi:hypothetical protein
MVNPPQRRRPVSGPSQCDRDHVILQSIKERPAPSPLTPPPAVGLTRGMCDSDRDSRRFPCSPPKALTELSSMDRTYPMAADQTPSDEPDSVLDGTCPADRHTSRSNLTAKLSMIVRDAAHYPGAALEAPHSVGRCLTQMGSCTGLYHVARRLIGIRRLGSSYPSRPQSRNIDNFRRRSVI